MNYYNGCFDNYISDKNKYNLIKQYLKHPNEKYLSDPDIYNILYLFDKRCSSCKLHTMYDKMIEYKNKKINKLFYFGKFIRNKLKDNCYICMEKNPMYKCYICNCQLHKECIIKWLDNINIDYKCIQCKK